MKIEEKREQLFRILGETGSCVTALSGGVDSAVLLAAAVRVSDIEVSAVTVRSPYVPRREQETAEELTRRLDVPHRILDISFPEELRNNPPLRCYLCKKALFTRICETAEEMAVYSVFEGSNVDELQTYRPGKRALDEMGVRSPLAESGLTKEEIRETARAWNLPVWDKPSYSCLLTRFPHDTRIEEKALTMVDEAELTVLEEGFSSVRVNKHEQLARIEVPPAERERICTTERMDRIDARLRELGYRYATFDMGGYRRGSMDPREKDR